MGILSSESHNSEEYTSVIVVGATGDLAHRKIFPALFALYTENHFPKNFQVVGFARSNLSIPDFKFKIAEKLECRSKIAPDVCGLEKGRFLKKLFYVAGSYDSEEAFGVLDEFLAKGERDWNPAGVHNRLFYFSIPPSVFLSTARGISARARSKNGWTRCIVEKPFGKDRHSSDELSQGMARLFAEEAIYRIDHYLGKEVVQNLMVLRFANLIFEPIWNRSTVQSVSITFKEELGVEGRGGYFDEYGIVRDVMQNHLLQLLALIAMEPPVSLDAEDVRDEKVKVLRCAAVLTADDVLVGQYGPGNGTVGYTEDKTVPKGSITPTFAAAVIRVRNRRWDGVPFYLMCGKGLDGRLAEIRIRFNPVPGNLFADLSGVSGLPNNELVIRVQPGEAILLSIVNKIPGLSTKLDNKELDLEYKQTFKGAEIPDAYERLILDVLHGDKSLFIRSDELEAAWDIFTPVLHYLEATKAQPVTYPFGSKGPEEAVKAFRAKHHLK
eukprot:CAMPEP_0184656812 /NCGR_PEP_ID=MMETSP0308-20130426/16771_1 /TAXON_ID=38269 /ORGANISM="Gloeochaete witrockiana, Strain SAG 46.84" /LENGTH=495 /DNA_ID=CAMNT_0027094099 /DNA_START=162 /DNA_END=1649 /DNA_ORIENTATION=+